MSLNKNDIVKLTITDIGTSGEGIGRVDGYTLFVKDTIIGDEVEVKVIKAKKNYGYGKLINIINPSKDRVTPVCPVLVLETNISYQVKCKVFNKVPLCLFFSLPSSSSCSLSAMNSMSNSPA